MEAIRRLVTTPIAEELYERCVDPIVRYLAPNIEKNRERYYAALFVGVASYVLTSNENDSYGILLMFNATSICAEILRKGFSAWLGHRSEGPGLGGLLGIAAFSVSGYLGPKLCVEGVKAISSRIFASV